MSGGKHESRSGGLNETFEKHRTLPQVWHRPAHSLYNKRVTLRFAVQAYFHDREIMVTLPLGVQGIFMHMKEAI